jgi:hypothetical protein
LDLRHIVSEGAFLNGERFRSAIARLLWSDDLRCYLANNVDALIDYGARYRFKLPISTSRAEGCVDEIANARMAKKQRMRWSPRGAHCVATVRAAAWTAFSKQQLISGWRPNRPEIVHS